MSQSTHEDDLRLKAFLDRLPLDTIELIPSDIGPLTKAVDNEYVDLLVDRWYQAPEGHQPTRPVPHRWMYDSEPDLIPLQEAHPDVSMHPVDFVKLAINEPGTVVGRVCVVCNPKGYSFREKTPTPTTQLQPVTDLPETLPFTPMQIAKELRFHPNTLRNYAEAAKKQGDISRRPAPGQRGYRYHRDDFCNLLLYIVKNSPIDESKQLARKWLANPMCPPSQQ